ncbi:cation diffusion facilitator family transporter [Micropruina sonneratiae]|uniref:cation diffusion facilitator family transporter n=1 Tax=Micropruina sonneratiae TaxID=2986940 RepID=UPI002226454B|nr:cation diffusion facilitator family transporter [Micropruina sp. KQZ13P-5]MCW3158921.1 cation diffusion facilitator family transporter [Micropruina sp. KQZ13P-5]
MTDTPTAAAAPVEGRFLERFLWLSLATAVVTVVLKATAAVVTSSVGLWSDALESTVNLLAAGVALWAMRLSAKPADHNHDFGHGKAEYLSAAVEGTLIVVAAVAIIVSAINRFLNPIPLDSISLGVVLAAVASVGNLVTGLILIRAGRRHRSITLEADGKHLMTDVWTSVGVLLGIIVVGLTHIYWLDPLIALAVGVNITFTGVGLVRRSVVGLLDATLPPEEVALIQSALQPLTHDPRVHVIDLRTRESGRQRFVQATLTVPGEWTVARSHDLADLVEAEIERVLPGTVTVVHVEPTEHWNDWDGDD